MHDMPPEEKVKGNMVEQMRWPSDRPAPANLVLWKFVI
jgi:hypothetical protein